MRETGWYWPDRVERPGGFLAHRLRRVSARLDALTRASSDGGFAAAGSPEEEVLQRPADPAVRAAVIAQTCEVLRHRRIAGTTHPVVSLKGTAEPDWESDCAVCGAPEAPRRPYARRSRSPHVCDACWAVAGEADTGAEGAAGVPVLA
ncbi:MAG: hypothetical protein O3A42_18370 [Actinobacteria bacterium]|nr:hypothetical protein [Actinomycetota bacterium]